MTGTSWSYLDEAHIHQDVDLGHGWGECGKRLFVASSSPGLLAKVSFSGKPLGLTYGLYFYNEGKVRLWPYPRANGGHTIDVLVPDPGPALYGTLRPYQKVGVQWLHLLSGLGLGACLADDMGLGKTIQVLSLLLVQKAKRASASEAAKSQPDLLVAPMGLSRDVVASVLVQLERHAGLSGIRIGDASLRQPALPHQQSFCAPRWPVPSTRKAGPTTTANGVRGNTTPRPSSLSQGVGQRFSGPCSLRIQSMIPTIAPLENGITQRLTAAMLS